jgi:hypothetical protein
VGVVAIASAVSTREVPRITGNVNLTGWLTILLFVLVGFSKARACAGLGRSDGDPHRSTTSRTTGGP